MVALARRALCLRNIMIVAILTVGILPLLMVSGAFVPVCDAGTQTLPFIIETKRMLSSGAPWWSWRTFMGENFIGAYSYYTLTNPFMWLCCLAPYSLIPFVFTLSLYLKYLVCGWVTDIYLRRMGFSPRLRLIGSLLFTFSSWMTCQLEYAFFIEPAIAFILLLTAIEAYLGGSRRGCTWLILGTFTVAFSNYYFAPGSLIAAAIYFIAKLTCPGHLGRLGSLRSLARAAGCVAVGIGLAAFVLVPVAMYIMHSNAGAPENVSFNLLERLRSLFMPTPFDGRAPIYFQATGWYMNAANIAVFGLFPSLYRIFTRPRHWLSVLLVIFILLYLTPAGAIFSLGTSTLYSRWLYALIICEVLATMYFIGDFAGRKVPEPYFYNYASLAFVAYAATAGVSLWLKIKGEGLTADREFLNLLWYLAAFIVNIGALGMLCYNAAGTVRWRIIALSGISISAVMQIMAFSANRCGVGTLTNVPGLGMAHWIASEKYDPSEPFTSRSEFVYDRHAWYHPYYNTAIVANRPGISSYLSLHSDALAPMVERFDSVADRVRIVPTSHRPLLYTMTGVRRVRSYDPDGALPPDMPPMRVLERTDRYTDYEFPYFITPGIVAERLEGIGKAWAMTDTVQMRALAEAQRRYKATFSGDTRGFSATVSLDHPAVVMYPVPHVQGFTAKDNGRTVPIYDGGYGMSALRLVPGTHNIRFDYFPPGLIPGLIISLVSLFLTIVIAKDENPTKNVLT